MTFCQLASPPFVLIPHPGDPSRRMPGGWIAICKLTLIFWGGRCVCHRETQLLPSCITVQGQSFSSSKGHCLGLSVPCDLSCDLKQNVLENLPRAAQPSPSLLEKFWSLIGKVAKALTHLLQLNCREVIADSLYPDARVPSGDEQMTAVHVMLLGHMWRSTKILLVMHLADIQQKHIWPAYQTNSANFWN